MIKSNLKHEFNCSIEKLWQIVTDNTNYTWRGDLSKIEIIDDTHFVEYAKNNSPTYFTITKKDYLKEYCFDIKNANIAGKWTGRFIKISDEKTLLDFTEEIETDNLLMKTSRQTIFEEPAKKIFSRFRKRTKLSLMIWKTRIIDRLNQNLRPM